MSDTRSIVVELSIANDGNVQCHLQTNDLPFDVVKLQLERFVDALQWQLNEQQRCPYYKTGDARNIEWSKKTL